MIRLFNQHDVRKQVELEGLWEFMPVKDKKQLPEIYHYKMMVPSCWESVPEFSTYRGFAAYRTTFNKKSAGNIKLTFKGVSHTADVYVDGQYMAHHYNAYTAFDVIVPKVEQGEHEIVVMVDNTFSEASALHIPNDYYTYGGLIRPVVLEEIDDVFIESIHFTPIYKNNQWQGEISTRIKNIGQQIIETKLNYWLNSHKLIHEESKGIVIQPQSAQQMKEVFEFDDIDPWSCENPTLYKLNVILANSTNECVDDLIERVGFRTMAVEGTKLLLNGEELFIQGFNRHEDYARSGCAIPVSLAFSDIAMMEDLGANSVRTSHYPNDERFLDLCDEKGMVVWEENHARGLSLERMQNPYFEQQCEDCINEMIRDHYNHPSIVIWGIMNECMSQTQEGRRMYEKQFNQIKTLDTSRPLTFASCRHFDDMCLDLVDIVSINIYFGWYDESRTEEEIVKQYLKEYQWIKEAGGKGKPLIISEFGAGAIYGAHDYLRGKWTEERQSDILDLQLSVYLNRKEIVGTYIWQFCDCRVTNEEWETGRPRSMNNKGIVNENRQPKLAYSTVQKHYQHHKK